MSSVVPGYSSNILYYIIFKERLELYSIYVNSFLHFLAAKHLKANNSPRPKLDQEPVQRIEI